MEEYYDMKNGIKYESDSYDDDEESLCSPTDDSCWEALYEDEDASGDGEFIFA